MLFIQVLPKFENASLPAQSLFPSPSMELKLFLSHYEAPCIIYILSNPDRNIEIQYSYIIWGILANFETATDYIQSLCVIGRVTRYYNHKHYVLLGG